MKKGFTLIELLAVIVILAIIALIATPMILGVVENAKKGAAESSILGYLDAVEKQKIMNDLDSDTENDISDGLYSVSDLNQKGIKVKGTLPTEGWVQIYKGKIVNFSLKDGDYYVNPKDGNVSKAEALKTGKIGAEPIATCPECVYAFPTKWYFSGENTTVLTDASQYKENYRDVISETGKRYFAGIKLNSKTKAIEKVYACELLVLNGKEQPICLQGSTYTDTNNASTYKTNKEILNSVSSYYVDGCNENVNRGMFSCYYNGDDEIAASVQSNGYASTSFRNGSCDVWNDGRIECK